MKERRLRIGGILLLLLSIFSRAAAQSPTPGVIYDRSTSTAGRLVLDRNGDGYTSATTAGFVSNDVTESEMIFTSVPQISLEPNSDILTAPTCGFTDFTDYSSDHSAVGVHLDSNNTYLVFRFRMSNTSSNSKGYSVLIDCDSKFGNTGPYADPNYVAPSSSTFGNPGFEREVLLATNFGVYVYDVDGSASPASTLASYTGHTNYQKSVALNTNCSQAYFLDFFVKLSDLGIYGNTSTAFRYAVNTVTSPHSALLGPISDVGGINDATYSNNYTSIWSNVVTAQTSTTVANITSMSSILQPPTVLSPIYNTATTIRIVNNDLASGYLTVYKQHSGVTSRLGITSLTASGATATLSSISVATGDIIWATDSVSGATVSLKSNTVTVIAGSSCNKPTAPVVTCNTNRGMQGTSLYSGATIKVYSDQGRLISSVTGGTTISGGTYSWAYDPSGGSSSSPCTSGNVSGNTTYGSYYVTVTTGGCESNYATSGSRAQSGGSTAACTAPAAPTVSTCNSSTGVIAGTSSVASDSIVILKNGTFYANTVANASKAWSYTGSFQSTDTILVAEYTGSNSCVSTEVLALVPPVVSSPIYNGATTVSGTSAAPAGTYIKVYKVGTSQSLGSTTVSSTGTWSVTVSALSTGNQIEAFDSLNGFKSSVSNIVTVVASPTSITASVTGTSYVTYIESGTSVSGTISSSSSGTLTLYEDGTAIGTTTISASTSWTVSGLSSTRTTSLDNYLYAGGQLTAKFTPTGGTEGSSANSVYVGCQLASTSKTVNATKYKYCSTEYGAVTIASSEAGVIYTMVNNGTSTAISPSLVGTGSTITLTASSTLSASKTVQVSALKISPASCSTTETDTAYLREDCDAVYTANTQSSGHVYTLNETLATVSDADGTITAASVNTGSLPPGSSINTSTGEIYVSDVNTFVASGGGTWPLTVNTTDNHTFLNSTGSTVNGTSTPAVTLSIANPLPVTLISFAGVKNGGKVNLTWTTVSEINNAYFAVERSADGKDFEAIGTRTGHGTTNLKWDYALTDNEPLAGTSFYRLKQVDYNGNFSYSNIVPIDIQIDADTRIKVYPNPLVQPNTLYVEITSSKNEVVNVNLTDVTGHIIVAKDPESVIQKRTIDLDVKNVNPGFYYLKVQTPGSTVVQKIEILNK